MKIINNKIIRILFISIISLCPLNYLSAQIISITDFGASPNSDKDAVPYIQKAIKYCKEKGSITLTFPKGTYNLYPQAKTNIGFDLESANNITIDGGGSLFIMHGTSRIAVIKNCSNTTLKNFYVDYKRPFTSQATILRSTKNFTDIQIDKEQYPYKIENNKLIIVGEAWERPAMSSYDNLYDGKSKDIVYNTWDSPLGNVFDHRAEDRGNGVIRLYGDVPYHPVKGTIITIYSAKYSEIGIDIESSTNTKLQDIRIYHSLGHAIYGAHSENITIDNAFNTPNTEKGRVFSSVADAFHFINCRGKIEISNCSPAGQGDDCLNIHGRNFKITRKVNKNSLIVETPDVDIQKGEEVWIVSHTTGIRGETRIVSKISQMTNEGNKKKYLITFTKPYPTATVEGDCLESKTWTPSVYIHDCTFGRKNRARGILTSTPKDVIIENNQFSTAGTSILLEGDMKYWYESGACNNVVIKNNTFDNCLSSGNAHGSGEEWGNAIISITPSLINRDNPYHKNITIEDNTFNVFDAPIMYARSVAGLKFINNRIFMDKAFKPYTWQKSAFILQSCKDVTIDNNQWGNYPASDKVIKFMDMDKGEILKASSLTIQSANAEGR